MSIINHSGSKKSRVIEAQISLSSKTAAKLLNSKGEVSLDDHMTKYNRVGHVCTNIKFMMMEPLVYNLVMATRKECYVTSWSQSVFRGLNRGE